jgi:hypothetical protein
VWCGWLTSPTPHSNLFQVSSCWIYIGIILGAHPILHIKRISVKGKEKYGYSVLYLKKRGNLKDISIDISIILKCILKKWDGGLGPV